MTPDELRQALDQAKQREAALAHRLEASDGALRETKAQLAVQQAAWADLEAAESDFERRRLAQAARYLNRVWESARYRASVAGRLRQRLQDAHLPLWWLLRHPLRFTRGAARLGRQPFRRQVSELAESRLFDPDYYRAVTHVGPAVNIVARFLLRGDAAGEAPHSLFDPGWYRLQSVDLADTAPPFQHYLQHGGWELRSPHPLFDARHYLSQFPPGSVHAPTPLSHFVGIAPMVPVSPHPLIDARYYLSQDPDLASTDGNILLHYLATATTELLDPHPLFSSRFYLENNPDLRGRNPLDHFVRQGAAEGRSPHPLFDVRYYWEQRPDVRTSGGNALLDYLARGTDARITPHPLFDTSYYLEQLPFLRTLGLNPLTHFLRWGWRDGLRPNPWFDPRWYLEQNPDVVEVNPLLHFAETGWREGRDPSPEFSLATYLAEHPDVGASGENPLEHHLRHLHGGRKVSEVRALWTRPRLPVAFRATGEVTGRELTPTLASTVPQASDFRLWLDARGAPPPACEASLRSLVGQLYPRWRVDVWIDPGSTCAVPPEIAADPRVRLRPVEAKTPHPAGDLMSDEDNALVAWLSAGDELEPQALLFAAHAAQGAQPADCVYADECTAGASDLIDPIFKPDWDPLLFESVDYLGPCAFVRARDLRASLDRPTSADVSALGRHGLLRSALRQIDRERIVHLPYVLARTHPTHAYATRATAPRPANLAALADTYGRPPEAPGSEPLVSIIIPTRNAVSLLSQCVDSILGVTSYRRFEILIVDNGSDDPAALAYLARLADSPRCRVIRSPGAFNYSRLNNLGASEAKGDIFCLLNNDIEVTAPDWLTALVAFARRAVIGAVGSTLLYPDGAIQHGGVVIGAREVAAHAFVGKRFEEPTYMNLVRYPREVSAVTGACLVVARSRYLEVGGLDDDELHVNFSDVDLCLKLRARGYRNIILPIGGIVHHESATRGEASRSAAARQQLRREALVMKQRWGADLRRDPYYSEHLALSGDLHRPESAVGRQRSVSARRPAETFTSLGREPRLDIYAGISNAARAAQATRARPSVPSLDNPPPGLSVLILNRDAPELLIPLVGQLASQQAAFGSQALGFEVLIGDTGSTHRDVLDLYDRLPAGFRVVRGMRYNFSRCNNALEGEATFDTVLFLNNDVILPADAEVLLRGYRTLHATPDLGLLGSVLFYPDGTIQHMGCALLDTPQHWGLPYHVNTRTRIAPASLPALATHPGVTGAFLLIGRGLFRRLGGFDPLYAAECQDIALCLDAYRLGFDTACAHLGMIVHIENATRPKGEENWADRQRFLRRYGALIQSLAE